MLKDSDYIPEYPIPTGATMRNPETMPWRFDWWLKSEIRLKADKVVQAIAFDLFCVAQDQEPVGTLPVNQRLLAKLLSIPLEDWNSLMTRKITPLHGWEPCTFDGLGIRFFHPICLEMAKEAMNAKGTT